MRPVFAIGLLLAAVTMPAQAKAPTAKLALSDGSLDLTFDQPMLTWQGRQASQAIRTEPALVRWVLTTLALLFLGLFLVLPLATVFIEAFAGGASAYLAAVTDPDAVAALRLTLLAAAIAVPANLVFGF